MLVLDPRRYQGKRCIPAEQSQVSEKGTNKVKVIEKDAGPGILKYLSVLRREIPSTERFTYGGPFKRYESPFH